MFYITSIYYTAVSFKFLLQALFLSVSLSCLFVLWDFNTKMLCVSSFYLLRKPAAFPQFCMVMLYSLQYHPFFINLYAQEYINLIIFQITARLDEFISCALCSLYCRNCLLEVSIVLQRSPCQTQKIPLSTLP
jgi:hypothetical protein